MNYIIAYLLAFLLFLQINQVKMWKKDFKFIYKNISSFSLLKYGVKSHFLENPDFLKRNKNQLYDSLNHNKMNTSETIQSTTLWNGKFYGNIEGVNSTLSLTRQANNVQGKIDASGYIYNISGTIENNEMKGSLEDPQTKIKIYCSGTQLDNAVVVPS